jgi:hypothetical protein
VEPFDVEGCSLGCSCRDPGSGRPLVRPGPEESVDLVRGVLENAVGQVLLAVVQTGRLAWLPARDRVHDAVGDAEDQRKSAGGMAGVMQSTGPHAGRPQRSPCGAA